MLLYFFTRHTPFLKFHFTSWAKFSCSLFFLLSYSFFSRYPQFFFNRFYYFFSHYITSSYFLSHPHLLFSCGFLSLYQRFTLWLTISSSYNILSLILTYVCSITLFLPYIISPCVIFFFITILSPIIFLSLPFFLSSSSLDVLSYLSSYWITFFSTIFFLGFSLLFSTHSNSHFYLNPFVLFFNFFQ